MWQNHAKNALLLVFVASILAVAPAITFLAHGHTLIGALIFLSAVVLATLSIFIAVYWHKQDIHATPLGFITAIIFFIVGVICLWLYGFYFWVPLVLIAIPTAWGHLTGKNQKT